MKKVIILSLILGSSVYAKDKKIVPAEAPPTPVISAEVAKPTEVKVGVKGMVCAFCAQGIEKSFNSQPEVSKVEVSLENKYVKVKFKDGKSLSNEKIAELLKDAGYEAVFGE